MSADKDVQALQSQVAELERQLAEAQAAIQTFSSEEEQDLLGNCSRQNMEQLNAVIQALHDPVLVYDQNGVIFMANASAVQAHGFDPTGHHRRETNQTLLARYPNGKIVHSDDLPSARALRGETVIDEALIITNSQGQELNILVTSSPFLVNGVQKGVVSVWHDVTEQQAAEKAKELALAQAEEGNLLLGTLLEFIPEGICITGGPPDFLIKRVSYYGLEMTGNLDPSRIVGLPAGQHRDVLRLCKADGVTPLAPEETPLYRASHFGEITLNEEMMIRTQDGISIPILMSAVPIRNAQGQSLAAINAWRDFTEIKQLEQDLRAARDRAMWLARLPGENPNPVARVSQEGIVLYHNSPAAKLPGWTCVVGEFLPTPLRHLVDRAFAQGQVMEQELMLGAKIYSIWVVPILNEGYANLYGRDITGQKEAEEALRASEEHFRSLADSMPQLVWMARSDGTVDYYNQRYHEFWGIKLVDGAGWDWAPVLHPDDLQPTVDAWQHSVETGEIYQIEHRVRMVDGSYYWHLSRGIPMFDKQGQIRRWFGTATNIHEQKLAQEKLKEYAEQLERSNRELEQFAFMASHDLQEPLRKIEVFGDLLLESTKSLSGRERNYLDRMRDAAGRMRDMVDGLLQLSRVMTQGKPFVQVNLSQVTSEVLYDLEDQLQRTGGRVKVETLPVVEGDPLQLRQLLQNLIVNALKYHPPDVLPEVKVYAQQLTEKVQIFVEDNGIGFEQEEAERIFQPFQRLVGRSQYEGSGIGLAICRRIVERHKGEIAARSQPGAGATFIVTLPVYQSENRKKQARKDMNNEDPGTAPGRGR